MEENHFEIPRRLDNYLASLAIYYQKQGHELLESIIVNSTYRVVEEYEYDGLDGVSMAMQFILKFLKKFFIKF